MKVCGIIAEYNPFHNGHKYHIDFSRRELSCDYIIVVMSGNFVQRGAPSCIDKYYRTRMALAGGADIVIELPSFYALQSAQYFALGAVSLLDSLGVVDYISYGSESYKSPASDIIESISNIKSDDKLIIEDRIIQYLISGNNYPLAYSLSYADYLSENGFKKADIDNTLSQPNTILELMYRQALIELSSDMQPFRIPRVEAEYHEQIIKGKIASATAIRRSMNHNKMYLDCVPNNCSKLIQAALNETDGSVSSERFFDLFLYEAIKSENALSDLADISGGLDKRMLKMLNGATDMDEYIKSVKSKSYTYVRIARTIFNLLLGITADDTALIRNDMPLYARILGFKSQASGLIDQMHEKSKTPVFANPSKFVPITSAQKRLFEIDQKASDLYYIKASKPFNKGSDFTNQIIVL